jgi:hypothetical protein
MVSAVDHGGTAAHASSEVLEEDATGDIKGIYEDIRNALRIPFVPDVFLKLATEPDYLLLAWRQLHTNVQTVYFERSADRIRLHAVERVKSLAAAPSAPDERIKNVLQTYNYLLPKLLIAITALRVATTGQGPRLADLPAEEKRQIATGVPEGMARPDVVAAGSATPEVERVFEDILNTLRVQTVSTEFRMLATSPAYFESAWNTFKELSSRPEGVRLQRELKAMADETVLSFPFRMDLSPHTLRLCGLTEAGIDKIREVLDRFHALVPLLTIGTAALAVSALGTDRAKTSPFPADAR